MADFAPINPEEEWPLIAGESGGSTNRVVRATIRRFADNAVLFGPFVLPHAQGGVYKRSGELVPASLVGQSVYIVIEMFDPDGITPNSLGAKVKKCFYRVEEEATGSGGTVVVNNSGSAFSLEVVLEENEVVVEVQDSEFVLDVADQSGFDIFVSEPDPVIIEHEETPEIFIEVA